MRIQGLGISFFCAIIIGSLFFGACGNKHSGITTGGPATVLPVARTLPPLPVRPLSPKLKAMRERAMQTASNLRELSFRDEVGMTELSGWEYGTRTREMAEALGGDELRALGRLASAGGALPEGIDLAQLAANFTALTAGATYSPLDKQILLVDKNKDDSLLAHEFVHALQDQNFDLMKLLVVRPYNFDRTEAVFALIEGDAMNVQRRADEGDAYGRKSLEEITRQENGRFGDYRKEVGYLFPPLLTETFIFRYRDGARFVEFVRRSKGQQGVDALFNRPPVSSEQILHPEKYAQGEALREVQVDEGAFAGSGWRAVTSTPLGEIGIRGLLMAGVADREATRAAAGWGGDRAYLFERTSEGSLPLFIWKTVWDRPVDAEEFFQTYNALQRRRNNLQVGNALTSGEEARMIWREAGRTTLIHRAADSVIIVRGAESDLNAALELARR
ncbi:MAG TPA: hypothetical protein VF708_22170 [Pyrinomonadaceae bacterium]|jgi:hypothetical protein